MNDHPKTSHSQLADGLLRSASEVYDGVRYTGSKFFHELSPYEQQMWDRVARLEALTKAELAEAQNRITALTGPIPLVPQTEVDELASASKLQCETIRRLEAELAAAKAELTSSEANLTVARAARDAWRDSSWAAEAKLAERAEAREVAAGDRAPSLPAVDSPEGLRYAARVVLATTADPWADKARDIARSYTDLTTEADRLEREQAEKAKRDGLLDLLAEAMYDKDSPGAVYRSNTTTGYVYRDRAKALLDRFDITPKRVES